jgi:putative nucleotidyltransferase with HDIG domain
MMKTLDNSPPSNPGFVILSSQRRVIREISQLLLKIKDERLFLNEVCAIIAHYDSTQYAWIGLIEEIDNEQKIKFVAQSGFEHVLTHDILMLCANFDKQRGPGYDVIMTRKPVVMNERDSDDRGENGQPVSWSRIILPLVDHEDVIGLLNIGSTRPDAFGDEEINFLTEIAGDIVVGFRMMRLEADLRQSVVSMGKTIENTIDALTLVLSKRDPYTANHQQRVSMLAHAIAKKLGLAEKISEGIRVAGSLHDIGKVYVPAEILSKPSKLTEGEFNIMKTHAQVSYDIIKSINFPWPVAPAVLQHHERMNGSGYPNGLSGDAIALSARILAVADVVEAMSSHRPYRPALGVDKALAEIKLNMGVLYDSKVAGACISLIEEDCYRIDSVLDIAV